MSKEIVRTIGIALLGLTALGLAGCGGGSDLDFSRSDAPVRLVLDRDPDSTLTGAIGANVDDFCNEFRHIRLRNVPIDPTLPATPVNEIVVDRFEIWYDNLDQEDIPGLTVPPALFEDFPDENVAVNGSFAINFFPFITAGQKFDPPLDGSGAGPSLRLQANLVFQGHLAGDESVIVRSNQFTLGVQTFSAGPTPDLDGDTCPDRIQVCDFGGECREFI